MKQNGNHNSFSHQIHVVSEEIDCTLIFPNSLFWDEEKKDGCWALEFHGAHSSAGSGIRMVLISLDKGITCFSYRIEFDCTNHIVEYEALILGLNLTIDMNIRSLHVRGDSDLIISQVKRDFSSKKPRLKQYRDVVWDAIKIFNEFSIKDIPREENSMADSLVVSASTLQPCEEIINIMVASGGMNLYCDP
jgi:ribonuclease HI